MNYTERCAMDVAVSLCVALPLGSSIIEFYKKTTPQKCRISLFISICWRCSRSSISKRSRCREQRGRAKSGRREETNDMLTSTSLLLSDGTIYNFEWLSRTIERNYSLFLSTYISLCVKWWFYIKCSLSLLCSNIRC